MVDKNDSLLREVEEELRREQYAKLWDKYGLYVIGLGALLIAAVGGFQLWKGRQLTLANEGGALYEQAAKLNESGKADEAAKVFTTLAEGGHRGYATLANLQLAGADLKAGKKDEAFARFEAITKDSTADPLLKSFAALQAASLRLGQADLQEMQNRLNDLAADGSPWRFYARELLGLAAYKAGDTTTAMQQFERILSDKGSTDGVSEKLKGLPGSFGPPAGVMQRVRVLMGTIMADLMAKSATTAPPPAAPAAADAKAPETAAPDGKAPDGAKTADDKTSPSAGETPKVPATK